MNINQRNFPEFFSTPSFSHTCFIVSVSCGEIVVQYINKDYWPVVSIHKKEWTNASLTLSAKGFNTWCELNAWINACGLLHTSSISRLAWGTIALQILRSSPHPRTYFDCRSHSSNRIKIRRTTSVIWTRHNLQHDTEREVAEHLRVHVHACSLRAGMKIWWRRNPGRREGWAETHYKDV